jgi:DNA-binding NtrC family response regulator
MHARLKATDRGLRVEDLGSTNGLYVGGALVKAALLRGPQCSFVIGRTTVSVLPRRASAVDEDCEPIPGLVGRSQQMRRLWAQVRRFAKLRAPVLLQGESGTGKDVVARALHQLSGRSGQLVAVNAGGLSEALADAELFGHQRGAFTGAVQNREGAFAVADGGTLFLDEIADLVPAIQVKLLRVIEDGVVRPLGTTAGRNVDVRIVSACWRPLDEQIDGGQFRQDLYHRISTVCLRLPPLRKRVSDLPALSTHLLSRMEAEFGPKELSAAALARLLRYGWPGNVRELGSVLYRAAALASTERVVQLCHVEQAMPEAGLRKRRGFSASDAERLLEQYDGNVSAAARAARLPRTTFRTLLRRGKAAGCSAA